MEPENQTSSSDLGIRETVPLDRIEIECRLEALEGATQALRLATHAPEAEGNFRRALGFLADTLEDEVKQLRRLVFPKCTH